MMQRRHLCLFRFAAVLVLPVVFCVGPGCGADARRAGDASAASDSTAADATDGQAPASDVSGSEAGGGELDASEGGGLADADLEETSGEPDGNAPTDGGGDSTWDAGRLVDVSSDGDGELDASGEPGVPLPTGQLCCTVSASEEPTLCSIRLARRSKGDSLPCALQLTLTWDAERVEVTGFSDTWCFDDQCFPLPVPPNGLSPSGHSMAIAPLSIEDWTGQGSIIATSLTAPIPPLTEAYYDGAGMLVGDAQVVDMSVRRKPASTTEEVCFTVSGLAIADSAALTLGGYAANSTLVTFGAQ